MKSKDNIYKKYNNKNDEITTKRSFKKKDKIDIIYVNYKNNEEIIDSIKSFIELIDETKYIGCIFVVDNSFNDFNKFHTNKLIDFCINSSTESPHKINYLPVPKNIGFGAGCNIGSKIGNSNFILFLNCDTDFSISSPKMFEKMLDQFKDEKIGIIGPKVYDFNNQLSDSAFKFEGINIILKPLNHLRKLNSLINYIFNKVGLSLILNKISYKEEDLKGETYVDWVSGCCLLISRKLFQDLKGFDERYFLYFEDIDLCRKLKEKDLKVKYFMNFKIRHKAKHESRIKNGIIKNIFTNNATRHHIFSYIKYCIKWNKDFR